MANSNGKIIAPVNETDLRTVLNTQTSDAAVFFGRPIVKWAKYKPVVNTIVDPYVSQWDSANGRWKTTADWWIAENGGSKYRYGMRFPMTNNNGNLYNNTGTIQVTTDNGYTYRKSTAGFFYDLANGSLRWTQQLPTGGASDPFRLSDFEEYVNNAVCPLPYTTDRIARASAVGAYNYVTEKLTQVAGGLDLVDILPPTAYQQTMPSLANMYVGVLFYNQAKTDFFWQTSEYNLSDLDSKRMRVALTDSEMLDKISASNTWYTRCFLCSKPLSWCQQFSQYDSPQACLVACDEGETNAVFLTSTTVEVEFSAKYVSQMVHTSVNILNATYATITLTNLHVDLLSESIGGYDVDQTYTFANQTLAVGANVQLAHNFSNAALSTHARIQADYSGGSINELIAISS